MIDFTKKQGETEPQKGKKKMKIKIVGLEHTSGTIKGEDGKERNWYKTTIYYLAKNRATNATGYKTGQIKTNTSKITELTGLIRTEDFINLMDTWYNLETEIKTYPSGKSVVEITELEYIGEDEP